MSTRCTTARRSPHCSPQSTATGGAAQAGESDGDGADQATGLPILDTYGAEGAELDALLLRSGAGQILVDLQDIGSRFYTYTWTLFDLMCSAARTGLPVVIADRPNPLGRRRLGPGLDPSCASFVAIRSRCSTG